MTISSNQNEPGIRNEDIKDALDIGWYYNPIANEHQMAKVPLADRAVHAVLLGASGTGKSRMLNHWIRQDIWAARGFCLLDPHLDLANDVLGFLAWTYEQSGDYGLIDDTIVVDLSRPDATVTINPLQAEPGILPEELAAEVLSAFKKVWAGAGWGVRMADLLMHACIACAEVQQSLLEVSKLLVDDEFRSSILPRIENPITRDYFRRFDTLGKSERIRWSEPVTNKINALLADRRLRDLFSSAKSSFSFRDAMDNSKMLIVKLDRGRLKEGADLLGALFLSMIRLAAFSRADTPESDRKPFVVYTDETAEYMTDSAGILLAEGRKFGVSLVMTAQSLAQLPSDTSQVMLGSAGLQAYFRMGRRDAERLVKEAFRYQGDQPKSITISGTRYMSMSEEFERRIAGIQDLEDRQCYFVHRRQGGVLPISTQEIPPAHELAGITAQRMQEKVSEHGFGDPYVNARDAIYRAIAERHWGVTEDESDTHDVSVAASKPHEKVTPNIVARTVSESPMPARELIDYLIHIASNPFVPAMERDRQLNLSRYKGGVLRLKLKTAGLTQEHKVGTGTRSGQLLLLECTNSAMDLLQQQRIKVPPIPGRGGFLHKFYAHQIATWAQSTWPDSTIEFEGGTSERPVDVLVRVPGQPERSVAFEIHVSGNPNRESEAIARDAELYDEVWVCAAKSSDLDSIKTRLNHLPPELKSKIQYGNVSQFIVFDANRSRAAEFQLPTPTSPQSLSKPEPEIEPVSHPPRRKRRTAPAQSLISQIESAFADFHDWDKLANKKLSNHPVIQGQIDPHRTMPEARAISKYLTVVANAVIEESRSTPAHRDFGRLLELYLDGESVAEIGRRFGVSPEWCSKHYRKKAIQLAIAKVVEMLNREVFQELN